ncbi:Peptidase cysteine/serine, trypsin-like containing protein [Cricetulus griseus]|uniref:Peptidase cysteine/serine, trypsin-like containing protein n=1 Tax=Cricetulus griseus TaxID=10029 RepID=A0A061HX86_CRIGR|nr:Peptidase cysteine/serine, trypsin-like containing protein [Cricetulus griseus]
MSHLDISGVNDPESIPRGQRICLYPKFDPQDENDPVKADIGLVILEEPLYGEEIPISQSSNISLKSCSKCQYRSCEVYEYQSSRKLGTTTVKKIAVQLLDFSTCYHQHSYLEKTEGLCIQSQPREDCWIQRASPVLCLLKNHWELVGLIHKTSRICQNPTVIIRTAPYFSWMKRFIKASKKLLNPTSSLHCRTMQESEHVPQIRHSHNYISTSASPNSSLRSLQRNLGISSQTKNVKNFPTVFNFSDTDSNTNIHKMFFDKSQTPVAVRLQAQQMKLLTGARLPENSGQNLIHQVTPQPSVGSFYKYPLSQLVSETAIPYTSPTADTVKPWGFVVDTPEQTFDKIMADIIKQWSPSVDDEVEPVHSHDASTTDEAWTGNAPNLEDYTNVKVMQNGSQNQYTTQANLTPNISLSDKVIPWGIFTPGAAVNKTVVPIEALISNKTFDFSLSEGARIPQPSGTVEPWSSLSNSIANSQDQPIIDSVRPQNHPVSHAGRLQIVPMINLGAPSTSKVVTYPSMPNDLESKNVPNQLPYSTPPTQGQSSFKGVIQPTAEINHN